MESAAYNSSLNLFLRMSKVIRILLLALQFYSTSQFMIGWRNVDCGSTVQRLGPNSLMWTTDKDFTKFGFNKLVARSQPLEEMNTLRIFPNRTAENCYILPTYAQTLRYLIQAGFFYGNYDDNDAPDSVLRSSIVSPNLFTPITLSVDLPPNQVIVFYFTEVVKRTASNDRRIVDIYMNGMKMDTVEAEVNKYKVVTLYPVTVVGPRINITLRPASFSTLSPMISAMEVFTRIVYGPAHGNILTGGTLDHFISVYLTLIQVFLLVNA
ncbi:hypothetical protein Pint_06177 [Pistacia integerrima]|uniref:Uncharacterized protein n=1 Tax=Pistacia integerrima TaxID=434235 RepID=A0ACC0Z987_9ROSI|nr:hypothetical protein Pint_06177 [Pistacia integerrima]